MDSLIKLEINHNLKPLMKLEKRMVLPDGIYSESTKTRLQLCEGVVVTQELSVEEFDTVDQVATLTSWQRLVFSDIARDRTAVELAEAMRKDGWTVELDEQAASLVLNPASQNTNKKDRSPRFSSMLIGAAIVWVVFFVFYGVKHDWEIPAKYYVDSALTVGLGSLIGFGLSVITYRRKLANRLDSDNNAPGKFPLG